MRHTISYLCPGCNRYGSFDLDDPKAGAEENRPCQYCGTELHGTLDLKAGALKPAEKEAAKSEHDDRRAKRRSERESR